MSWDPEMIVAHELGHLIVSHETGLALGNIKLETSFWTGEVNGGYCELRSLRYPAEGQETTTKDWAAYRGMLLMTAGGQAASEYWFQLHDRPIEFTAGSDYAMFSQDAPVMPNAPTWEQAKEEARQIIVSRWGEVVQLTPGLIANRRLSGGRVA